MQRTHTPALPTVLSVSIPRLQKPASWISGLNFEAWAGRLLLDFLELLLLGLCPGNIPGVICWFWIYLKIKTHWISSKILLLLPGNRLSLNCKSAIKTANASTRKSSRLPLHKESCSWAECSFFSFPLALSLLSSWSQPSPYLIKTISLWTDEWKGNQRHVKEPLF